MLLHHNLFEPVSLSRYNLPANTRMFVVTFPQDALKCPRPAAVGDIIRLHRVKLAQWDNKPQIQGE
jgi:hypothetical protein